MKTTGKELKEKAISIKGKSYVLVSDRILYFNEQYPNGFIQTKLLSKPDANMVMVKAAVTPNIEQPERFFTGLSQAVWGDGMVNKTAALENCETSAVGRALAMMGIGVIDSVASVDEISKAQKDPRNFPKSTPENDVMERAMQNSKCPKCGASMKKSVKGNYYCEDMCWKK